MSTKIAPGQTFSGRANMGDMEFELNWCFVECDFEACTFTFSQRLSQGETTLESSEGTGTFVQHNDGEAGFDDIFFEDPLTTFTGIYSYATGIFNGNATQKDASGEGTFEMTAL